MFSILGIGAPFQIADIIVVFVSILVIDTWQIVRIGKKCFSNQSVCHSIPVMASFPQTYKFISIWVTATIQDLGRKILPVRGDPFT